MDWKNKMKQAVEEILNYDLPERKYVFTTKNGSFYFIEKDGKRIYDTETSDNLASHWREHVNKCIHTIMDYRIREELKNF